MSAQFDKESFAGAAACIKALQSAVKIERQGFDDPETNDNTVERYFRDHDEIKAAFLKGVGPLSAFQSGFVATLAEFVHVSMAAGEPDPYAWKPESLMTESEVEAERAESKRWAEEEIV